MPLHGPRSESILYAAAPKQPLKFPSSDGVTVWLSYNDPTYSEIGFKANTFQICIQSFPFLMEFGYSFTKLNKGAPADIAKRDFVMPKK